MIRYWRAGLTVASIQPKLLLLTKMVRTPGFVMLSCHAFLIVLEPHCLGGEVLQQMENSCEKLHFQLCVLVCHHLFYLLPCL